LVVIGIDPGDKGKLVDELMTFLSKNKVTYPLLFDNGDAACDYKVSGYPTLYLLDRNGVIIYSLSGYNIGMDMILEPVILKSL
jgi:hypothetical protein